jgi:translation initiation factor IF-1
MPKNSSGGKGAKRNGNKHAAGGGVGGAARHVQLADEAQGEMYAVALSASGGDAFVVFCSDGVTRRMIIRGKFRKQRGRHNVVPGCFLRVAKEEYVSETADKPAKVHMLSIYTAEEERQLPQLCVNKAMWARMYDAYEQRRGGGGGGSGGSAADRDAELGFSFMTQDQIEAQSVDAEVARLMAEKSAQRAAAAAAAAATGKGSAPAASSSASSGGAAGDWFDDI